MRFVCAALIVVALLPGSVAAQAAGDDEPPVARRKVERFGANGRLFAVDRDSQLVLISRQAYAAEHGAGFIGEFQIKGPGAQRRVYRYEAVCASQREGYRLVRATADGAREQDEAYSASIDEKIKAPKQAEKAAYNLYWAACRRQFSRFR